MRQSAIVPWLFAPLVAACTFEPGSSFATLRPSLSAAYLSVPDREAGQGWQKLNNDYQIRITRAELELEDIRLLASSGGGPASFEPARPPPGYTLCHNGHCHSSEGRLVPYAEIEAELAGGRSGGGLQVVVTLTVERALDLLMPVERSLACKPSCNLDRSTILRASSVVRALSMEGIVRDGQSPARIAEIPFRWDLRENPDAGAGASAPMIEADLNVPADRKNPPAVTMQLRVELMASLFDEVEFDSLGVIGGVLDLAAPSSRVAGERLLKNLAEGSFLAVSISRHEK